MRKKQAKKRPLLPDPKFNDKLVTRFVNMLMWSGKKSIAFRILCIGAFQGSRMGVFHSLGIFDMILIFMK